MKGSEENLKPGGAGFIIRIFRPLLQAVFPDRCLACGRLFHPGKPMPRNGTEPAMPLKKVFQDQMHPFLCGTCLPAFTPVEAPICRQCGKPFQSRAGESHLCGDCITEKRFLNRIRSAGLYEGALMKVIHALKYRGKLQLAKPLGRLLFHTLTAYDELARTDLVVPIPLHRSRMRRRGFNQAQLLVREWPAMAAEGGRMVNIAATVLARSRKTRSQTGLGKKARKANIRGAFSVRDPGRVAGKQVLLIDDVYTTGATAEECARTLMKNGAGWVGALTLARAE